MFPLTCPSARSLLAGLLLVLAACGTSRPPGVADSSSATAVSSPDTTPAAVTEPGAGTTTPAADGSTAPAVTGPVADDELPGEPFDYDIPRPGDRMAVVGVAHDDVLNLRALPGADQPIVDTLSPLADDVVVGDRKRILPDHAGIWIEVTDGTSQGWVSSSFLGYLGVVDDWTSQVVEANGGGVPAGPSMEALGKATADLFVRDEPEAKTRVVQVAPAMAGDLGEVTFDVIGFLDDSQLGVRLHLFGAPQPGGGYTLTSAEATTLCRRGANDAGACL